MTSVCTRSLTVSTVLRRVRDTHPLPTLLRHRGKRLGKSCERSGGGGNRAILGNRAGVFGILAILFFLKRCTAAGERRGGGGGEVGSTWRASVCTHS